MGELVENIRGTWNLLVVFPWFVFGFAKAKKLRNFSAYANPNFAMPIAKYFECGKSVSNSAKNCPHCGAFEPAVSVKEHNRRVKEEDDSVKMLWGGADSYF